MEYHYPPIPENCTRRKGEEYFKPMELNGSRTGTAKEPKISLLQEYLETIVLDIHEKVVNRFNDKGNIPVCIVKQEDGAGLHTDHSTYVNTMNNLFCLNDWFIFKQPS